MAINPRGLYTPPILEKQLTGMIKTQEADRYSARVKIPVGILTSEVAESLAEAARRFGRGQIYLTARLGIEIPGIRGEEFPALRENLAEAGVRLAGCGPRMRSTVACKGTVCPHGNIDTFDLAWEIDLRFNNTTLLPHKFKVAVAGCASTCSKPEVNDVGLVGVSEPRLEADVCVGCQVCTEACHVGALRMEQGLPVLDSSACVRCGDCTKACLVGALPAAQVGVDLYVGGRWGRHKQVGIRIAETLSTDQAITAVGQTKDWYAAHGKDKERLGKTLLRLGVERAQAEILKGIDTGRWVAITPHAVEQFQVLCLQCTAPTANSVPKDTPQPSTPRAPSDRHVRA